MAKAPRAHEALDCRTYARAAVWIAGLDRWSEERWAEAERELNVGHEPLARSKCGPVPPSTIAKSPDVWLGRRQGWLR
jgi:phage terminase large subunit GpA-like protein